MPNEMMIFFGGEVKALDDNGKVGGHLVRFSDASEGKPRRDLTGEYFTAKTYLGKDDGDGVDVLFHHGIPVSKELKAFAEHIFSNPVKTKRDEIGIWAETVLDQSDDYEKAVFELVKKGKLGWSSGSTTRVVRKSADGEITRWPIIEASLTHKPCDPLNRAIEMKAVEFFEELFTDAKPEPISAKGVFNDYLAEQGVNFWRLESALCETIRRIAKAAASSDITGVTVDTSALIAEAVAEYSAKLIPMLAGQVTDWLDTDQEHEFYVKALLNAVIANPPETGMKFADRLDVVLAAVERTVSDAKSISEMRAVKAGRKISKARMTKLKEIMGQLEALMMEVEPMDDDKKKSVESDDLSSLAAEFEQIRARQILAR